MKFYCSVLLQTCCRMDWLEENNEAALSVLIQSPGLVKSYSIIQLSNSC